MKLEYSRIKHVCDVNPDKYLYIEALIEEGKYWWVNLEGMELRLALHLCPWCGETLPLREEEA